MRELERDAVAAERRGHGGDLGAARRAFPSAPEPWLDLSTGINPFSYPVPTLPREIFTRLPEPAALTGLERAARLAYRAPPPLHVVAAPGSQILIGLLPRLLAACRVGVLGFTYSEHEASWRAAGASVSTVEDIAALEAFDVALVVNPNNPDGRLVSTNDLVGLAGRLDRRGGVLVVDEAFVDFLEPGASLVPVMPESGVVVLRSFGKAYGLPGVRLGFAIVGGDLAARLRSVLGPWSVCGPALTIGTRALGDSSWRGLARRRLLRAGTTLDRVLATAGLVACGGSVLFRLVEHPDAAGFYEELGRAGISVRRFAAQPSRLRFGIPAGPDQMSRLCSALHDGRARDAVGIADRNAKQTRL
jgi:cobalamin biosynthetic protein CobC